MESTNGNPAVGELVEIVSRYTHQLLYGCRSPDCTEVVCVSGNTNTNTTTTTRKPVRRHKPRTAIATAIGLAGQQKPQTHFCKHNASDGDKLVAEDESPRDPSSLIQLLCDTKSIQQLMTTPLDIKLLPDLEELRRRHALLRGLLQSAGQVSPLPSNAFVDNSALADGLGEASMLWLIQRLPPTRPAPWIMINRDVISKGLAYPQKNESMPSDDSYNRWTAILDILNHEPYLRLFQSTMTVVGRRTHLEEVLRRRDPKHELYPSAGRAPLAWLVASALGAVGGEDARYRLLVPFSIMVWLKRLFAQQWSSQPAFVSGGTIHGILELFRHLHHNICQGSLQNTPGCLVPDEIFEMSLLNAQVDTLSMARSYMDWDAENGNRHHVMEYPMLFSMKQLSLHFRAICHLIMKDAHSLTDAAVKLRERSGVHMEEDELSNQVRSSEQPYLLISVSRDRVLEDTWTQLWQRRKNELRRPLRVRLGEASELLEVGQDLGGVQIEFFNLVCREVSAVQTQMFITDTESGISYFRPGSLQPLYMFELFGLVVALALYNGIALPVRLPKVLYMLLSHPKDAGDSPLKTVDVRLQDLDDRWSHEVQSLQSIMHGDVGYLDYSFPFEANGLQMSVRYPDLLRKQDGKHRIQVSDMTLIDGGQPANKDCDPSRLDWPGWLVSDMGQAEDVTSGNKAQYVKQYKLHLHYGSVAPQVDAFIRGFYNSGLIPPKALKIFQPHQLKVHLEGSDHLDIDDLRAATRYDGYDAKSKYIQTFWRVVSAWPQKKQKRLLKFVTAAERIPITGASQLTFVIKRLPGSGNLETLPTSSTCFGTLTLPKYPSAEILGQKLSLALQYAGEGFGNS